jgi:hypothetical protein
MGVGNDHEVAGGIGVFVHHDETSVVSEENVVLFVQFRMIADVTEDTPFDLFAGDIFRSPGGIKMIHAFYLIFI